MSVDAPAPIVIRASVLPGPNYTGKWVPLLLIVSRSSEAVGPARVREIVCDDRDVQLDLDRLDRDTPINPGETYRLAIRMLASRPKVFGLGHIQVYVREGAVDCEPLRLPAGAVPVYPAIADQIAVELESLCLYQDGTKVLLTLRHIGAIPLQNLTVNLLPPESICGGKLTLQRPSLKSGEIEQLALVVAGKELDVVVTADVDGQRTELRQTIAVKKPLPPDEKRFHFLEPRQLSSDKITMNEAADDAFAAGESGEDDRASASFLPADSFSGVRAAHGGKRYRLTIQPQHPGVTEIDVRGIPGIIQVRDKQMSKDGSWRFLIDVTFADLLRKPEVIYYDVKSRGENLTGEVPICLTPPWMRHWQVAGALGVALTVQGVAAIGRFLHTADFDMTSIAADFDIRQDYNLFFLFSVPAALGAIKLVDWVQYRWGQ